MPSSKPNRSAEIYRKLPPLVGMSIGDAFRIASKYGFQIRVLNVDDRRVAADDATFLYNRVNISIQKGGVVVDYDFF